MKLDNDKARAAFSIRNAEINTMLIRLQALSAKHFEFNPDEINWGHVDNLDDMSKDLREICDRAFQDGEYAK